MLTRALVIATVAAGAASAAADVVTLNPVADAFVSSANPASNYGGAGALSVAAGGLPQGEFQTVLRFDTTSAVAAFNAAYGAGNWLVTDISLTLTSTSPSNPIFNAAAAGGFSLYWMQNDSWVEGTGGPSSPGATGITFATLPGFTSPSDAFLGGFVYGGATSGTVLCQPAFMPSFLNDLTAGGPVSFRMSASTAAMSWVFNSRSFGTITSRPALSITAIPTPGALVLALALYRPRARR